MSGVVYRQYVAEKGSPYERAYQWYAEQAIAAQAVRSEICGKYGIQRYTTVGNMFLGVVLSQEDAQQFPELFNRKKDGEGVYSPDPRRTGGRALRKEWRKADYPDRFDVSRKVAEFGGEPQLLEKIIKGNWYQGGAMPFGSTVVWGVPLQEGETPPVIEGLTLLKESEYHAMKEQHEEAKGEHNE
jgi:hypothetical protein